MGRLVKVKLALPDGDHLLATEYVADASGQWERKLISISPIDRSCTLDRSFERGGFSVLLDDTDDAYKDMMSDETNRKIKDKVVTVYVYSQDNSTLKETITATIYNWSRPKYGQFLIECVQEFAGKMIALPSDKVISATDWPNAPAYSLGYKIRYPSGVCHHGAGSIHCRRVDNRPNAKYLITWSDPGGNARILTIEQVFAGVPRLLITDSGDYSLVRDANGWEYITLDSAYKDYAYCTLNLTAQASQASAGNPVDCLREQLDNAGVTLVDDGDGGTDDMEAFCDTNSWGIRGALETETVRELLEIWCWNFDCFWRIDATGQVHIKHIDWSSITADATLTERHFDSFSERASNDDFANRIRAKYNYDYGNHKWDSESVTDSTDGDILPAVTPVEVSKEYAVGLFSGAITPMQSQIKYIDHPIQIMTGRIPLYTYETLDIELLSIIDVTHSLQIGASGKYMVLREIKDYFSSTVEIQAVRLWGA